MFPLETSIFQLIVLAISNHIRPNLGRHSHRVDPLPSQIIFMLAQKCPPSNDRNYKACSTFRNHLVMPWMTMHWEGHCAGEKKLSFAVMDTTLVQITSSGTSEFQSRFTVNMMESKDNFQESSLSSSWVLEIQLRLSDLVPSPFAL